DYKVTLTRLKQDFILTVVQREVNRRRLTRDSPWWSQELVGKTFQPEDDHPSLFQDEVPSHLPVEVAVEPQSTI
ncbi:hypothetical protein O181_128197, partial [Austropuccinia psidii MF-1]|nr:hypothetical protein [Austropuccinia psidii MF-1]